MAEHDDAQAVDVDETKPRSRTLKLKSGRQLHLSVTREDEPATEEPAETSTEAPAAEEPAETSTEEGDDE